MKKRETKFRELVEVSSDWIWEVNKEGVCTYSSPQVEVLLGYKPEEIVGKKSFDLMPPEESVRIKKFFSETTKNVEPIVALEYIVLHKDGRRIILETSSVPFFDKTGNVLGYRGMDRDITERKKMEEKLIRLSDAFKMSTDSIIISDPEGKITDVNEATLKMYGTDDKTDLIGKNSLDIVAPEDKKKAVAIMKELIKKGVTNQYAN